MGFTCTDGHGRGWGLHVQMGMVGVGFTCTDLDGYGREWGLHVQMGVVGGGVYMYLDGYGREWYRWGGVYMYRWVW